MEASSGLWRSKADPEIEIYIERVYKRKDTVNFHYFMCKLTGGGTLTKEELVSDWEKVEK